MTNSQCIRYLSFAEQQVSELVVLEKYIDAIAMARELKVPEVVRKILIAWLYLHFDTMSGLRMANEALEIDPGNEIAICYRWRALINLGDYLSVEAELEKSSVTYEGSFIIRGFIEVLHENWESALDYGNRAVAFFPTDWDAKAYRDYSQWMLSRDPLIAEDLVRSFALHRSSVAGILAANISLATGSPDRAMELTRQCVVMEPDNTVTQIWQINQLHQLQRYSDAAVALLDAMQRRPADRRFKLLYCENLSATKRGDELIAFLEHWAYEAFDQEVDLKLRYAIAYHGSLFKCIKSRFFLPLRYLYLRLCCRNASGKNENLDGLIHELPT